jgi:hypothetical protein
MVRSGIRRLKSFGSSVRERQQAAGGRYPYQSAEVADNLECT